MKKNPEVDKYINNFGGITKDRLEEVRAIVESVIPDAEEKISYGIPAYFVDGKMVIYFAGYKNHIGMYPGNTKSDAYNQLAAKYAHGKSTARFPHDEPLPTDIIKSFISVRLAENKESK